MKTEYEVKILDTDFESIKNKLEKLGATCEQPRRLMKRYIIDFADTSLQKNNAYIRVRDEGDRVTTSYKLTESRSVDGVKEAEVEVGSVDEMVSIYEGIGLKIHSYQETYRESWKLGDVEIEFDEWPWLDPYIEIEASSEDDVRQTLKKLGYKWGEAIPGDVVQLYQDIFDIDEWEIARAEEIKFGPVPDWLEKKRR